jgi:hypothetical protein
MNRRLALVLFVLGLSMPALSVAETPQSSFVKSWEGKSVTLKQVLYTLVYNERGKLGAMHAGRRDGLTVVTSSGAVYFQFDGRSGRDDLVAREPQTLADAVNNAYQSDALDIRSERKVEPIAIHQYVPGLELVVSKVRFERDLVRVSFIQPGADTGGEPATELTIKWPMPLSKTLAERDAIDGLIRSFVEMKARF